MIEFLIATGQAVTERLGQLHGYGTTAAPGIRSPARQPTGSRTRPDHCVGPALTSPQQNAQSERVRAGDAVDDGPCPQKVPI